MGIPLHQQARHYLLELIQSDEYKNGKMLPKEVDLARQLGISRNTLRQAINLLVYEGKLVRKKGVGTRVASKGIAGGVRNWHSFTREMNDLGIEVRTYELFVRHRKPSAEIAHFFQMDPEKTCVSMERVRGNNDYPFVQFISYYNPSLPITGEENYSQPVYEMLEDLYGIVVKTSREEVTARLAGDEVASKLGIRPKDPILVRKRFVYDENDRPVEYNVCYYRADSFIYTLEVKR